MLFKQYEIVLDGEVDDVRSFDEHIYFYLNLVVGVALFWSLSDWFFFDKDNVLVSWRDVLNVLFIDLMTNGIKFIYEMFNFVIFLALCALVFAPLTLFVLLRTILCPCLFGYGNSGSLFCNLFETV